MIRMMTARLRAKDGRETELTKQIASLAKAVLAEPGNIRFETYDEGDGNSFFMIEAYRDDAAFDAHLAMPHTRAFNDALKDLVEGGGSSVTNLSPLVANSILAGGPRGIDHIGLTVPDIHAAARFFAEAFGAVAVYDVLAEGDEPMQGAEVEEQLGLSEGTRIVHMRLMRIANGPSLEIFRMENGPQREAAKLQDIGLSHFGLYVDDIQEAAKRFESAGGELLSPPHSLAGVEDGPRNAGVYGRAPWGMLIELLTYPDGIAYREDAPEVVRWTPQPLI